MTNDSRTLETAISIDAERRWVLQERADGHFEYAEYSYVDLRPDGDVEGHWSGVTLLVSSKRLRLPETMRLKPSTGYPASYDTMPVRSASHPFATFRPYAWN